MGFVKILFGLVAGVASSALIGFCIYFDQKRRSDPDYKKKVRERRLQERKKAALLLHKTLPDHNDQEAVERFFLQEIQIGELLIQKAEYDGAAEHLYNALAVCGEPGRLIQIFQATLPEQVYAMVILKMKEINNRIAPGDNEEPKITVAIPQPNQSSPVMVMDDVE